MVGRVKTIVLDRGFFFIETVTAPGNPNAKNPRERKPQTTDYFAHRSALCDGLTIEELRVGDELTFTADPRSPKGPRADEIRRTLAAEEV